MNKKSVLTSSILAALMVFVASCGPKPAPTMDPAVLAQTVSVKVTELAVQTLAAYKSPTAPPTTAPTSIPAPTLTPVPTEPKYDFTGNEIFTAFLEGGKSQVSIIVPNGIKGDFTAKIDEKDFSCFSYIMKTIPRLICVGPSLPRGKMIKINVFPKDSQTSIFERQFTVPY
jgi:hypothetical protein